MTNSSRRTNDSKRGVAALACAALFFQGGATPSASPASNHVRAVDAARSWIKVHVGKVGLFSFAADEHEVDVPIASGSFDEETGAVELTIDAAQMRVEDPPSRRDKVEANMLGPEVLDAAKYPTIAFRSTGAKVVPEHSLGDAPRRLTIVGDLTLHGQTHPVSVVAQSVALTHFTGSAVLNQTAFGIAPIKVAGGAVRVKDQVGVTFEIELR